MEVSMNRTAGRFSPNPAWRRPLLQRLLPPALGLVALLSAIFATATATAQLGQPPNFGRQIPKPSYFDAIDDYNAGQYGRALDQFEREWRGAIKTAQSRWVDSICFHTMMGECYYQMGKHPQALDQYNAALNQFLASPNWMIRVQFPVAIQVLQPSQIRNPPWGTAARRTQYGHFPQTVLIQRGNIDNNAVVQQGGVVEPAHAFPVVIQEIVRCTAQACRRRRELLGPLASYDPLSAQVLGAMSGAIGPANHWSGAWVDVQLGCAMAAVGKDVQAKGVLERACLAGGQFDHPLTCLALMELARIELSLGNYDNAAKTYYEASVSAFQYGDQTTVEEALRAGHMAHIMANGKGAYPPLNTALAWAKQRRLDSIFCTVSTALAESLSLAGDPKSALAGLQAARSAIARSPMLAAKQGARLNLQTAIASYQLGQMTQGDAALASAMAFEQSGSLWLFQIAMTDKLYQVEGRISAREAFESYQKLLREPQPADWLSEPLEALAVLANPHPGSFESWFRIALIERKEVEAAIEIADMARRHRFHSTTGFGGRVLSLAWVLDGPDEVQTVASRQQKQDLLAAFPAYGQLQTQAVGLRDKLAALPFLAADGAGLAEQTALYAELAGVHARQEVLLREIALRRQPCEMLYPPKRKVEDVRAALGTKQAVIDFFYSGNRLFVFMITKPELTWWEIKAPTDVSNKLVRLLRELGHVERNRAVTASLLQNDDWRKVSHELFETLLLGPQTNFPQGFEELCIVPDGVLWYVPFESLDTGKADLPQVVLSKVRIRYAPTFGLAIADGRGIRNDATTVIDAGRLHPQEADGATVAAAEELAREIPGSLVIGRQALPAASSLATSFIDRLIVLDDIVPPDGGPYGWAPLPFTRGTPGSEVEQWMGLPWRGPDQILLPGFHTPAEISLKNVTPANAGQDLFLTACVLQASGTRTALISRWRNGGQTAYSLMREFARELDHSSPSDAWQRSVLLALDSPLEPANEPRVQTANGGDPLTSAHPFFWGGYMLIDSGAPSTTGPGPAVDPAELEKIKEKQRLLEELKKREQEKKDQAAKEAAAAEAAK